MNRLLNLLFVFIITFSSLILSACANTQQAKEADSSLSESTASAKSVLASVIAEEFTFTVSANDEEKETVTVNITSAKPVDYKSDQQIEDEYREYLKNDFHILDDRLQVNIDNFGYIDGTGHKGPEGRQYYLSSWGLKAYSLFKVCNFLGQSIWEDDEGNRITVSPNSCIVTFNDLTMNMITSYAFENGFASYPGDDGNDLYYFYPIDENRLEFKHDSGMHSIFKRVGQTNYKYKFLCDPDVLQTCQDSFMLAAPTMEKIFNERFPKSSWFNFALAEGDYGPNVVPLQFHCNQEGDLFSGIMTLNTKTHEVRIEKWYSYYDMNFANG